MAHALLLLFAANVLASPPSFEELRSRALKAYQRKDYARACPLYARAAGLRPEDAAIHADLGLCLARLGKKEEALQANARAVFLARPGRDNVLATDARTRRNAYFNLHQLGSDISLPEPHTCAPLAAAPGCSRPVHACTVRWSGYGSGGGSSGVIVNLALTPEAVALEREEGAQDGEFVISPGDDVLDFSDEARAREDFSMTPVSSALVSMSEVEEMFVGRCLESAEWKCAESNEVYLATEACMGARSACDAGVGGCPERQRCFEEVCERLTQHPTPGVRAEQKRAKKSEAACNASAEALTDTHCTIVLADACASVVGVVCETSTRQAGAKQQRRIGEVFLREVTSE